MSRDNLIQVAASTPFDTKNGQYGFGVQHPVNSTQDALEELREHTIYYSQTHAISAAGTLNLPADSSTLHYLTGSGAGYSVLMPPANQIMIGSYYTIVNTTNEIISIKDNAGSLLFTLAQQSIGFLYLRLNPDASGTWIYYQALLSSVATGIINYNLISSTPFSTSVRNPTFTPITSFSITPQAGTYGIWYNASVYYTKTPKGHWWRITRGGVALADTLRRQDTAHSNQTMVDSTMTVASFDGSQACAVEVSCDNTGTLTVNDRSLILIRLGT